MKCGTLAVAIASVLASAGPVQAACTVGKFAELPVTMAGLRPMVDATIDGHSVRFLADSGAFYSLITPGTAAELGLKLEAAASGFRLRGAGGTASASLTRVKEFTIAGQPIRDLFFLVGGSEVGGAGLFGQNFLGLRDAEYDLAGGMIRLMNAHDCGRANLAYWANGKPVAEIELRTTDRIDPHILGTVVVNGVPMRALFDTGAPTSALSVAAAARAGVHVSDPGVTPAGFGSGIGRGTFRTWIAPFKSFAIGDEQVNNTRLRIAERTGDDFDMLVGADFFLSHHIYVANGIHRMFLTYNGGPVFNLRMGSEAGAPGTAATAAADGPAPTSAGDFARRGDARAARHDFTGALQDLDQAVTLAPEDAAILSQRARVHMALRQPLLAAGDLDQSIKLRPEDVEAHMLRANLRFRANDKAGAREDADAAARAAPKPADVRLSLGALYDALGAPAEAVGQLDLWIAAHPADSRRPTALNARCWARALTGQDLALALADCNAALRARPDAASFLDSRGLVHLRMKNYDRSIADYDAALKGSPRLAWSLYGRGLAKRAKGATVEGDADITAAVAIAPNLPAEARRYGIVPAG